MPFDVEGQFDIRPFDISAAVYRPPSYDGVTIPPWFSSAINQNPGSNVYKLQQAYFGALATIAKMHVAVYYAGYLDTATGISLDRLAREYGISRNQDETDTALRARTFAKIALGGSSGTTTDISAAVGQILNMPADEIYIDENVVVYPKASISVRVCGNPGVVIPWSTVDDLVMQVKPAGVHYVSADYTINAEWVAGATGYGYDSWGDTYPSA